MFAHLSRLPLMLAVPLTCLATAAFVQTGSERTTVLEASLPDLTVRGAWFAISRIDPDGTAQLRRGRPRRGPQGPHRLDPGGVSPHDRGDAGEVLGRTFRAPRRSPTSPKARR